MGQLLPSGQSFKNLSAPGRLCVVKAPNMVSEEIQNQPEAGETALYAPSKRAQRRSSRICSPRGGRELGVALSSNTNQTDREPTNLEEKLAQPTPGKGTDRALLPTNSDNAMD